MSDSILIATSILVACLMLAVLIPFWNWRSRLKKYRDNGWRDADATIHQYSVDTAKEMAEKMGDSAYAEGFRLRIKQYEEG